MDEGSLEGRVALVTGASRGIGRATALALSERGVRVAAVARSAADLQAVAAARGQGEILAVPADVSRADDVREAVRRAREAFGAVDILVNNAGIGIYAPIEQLREEDWDAMMAVNLKSVFLCCQAVLPLMRARRRGHIVNIASIRAWQATPRTTGYATTKFGLLGFSQALAQEVIADGIRVSVISPGGTRTHFGGTTPDQKRPELLAPEEVARGVLYALSAPPGAVVTQVIVLPATMIGSGP
ncbi:MAG TPA: SDR family oxidoreductase [bacterium]|nr:SDR family oxidoreductase [bacterium]